MSSSPRSSTEGRSEAIDLWCVGRWHRLRSGKVFVLNSLHRTRWSAEVHCGPTQIIEAWRTFEDWCSCTIAPEPDPSIMPPRFHLFGAPQRQGRKHA